MALGLVLLGIFAGFIAASAVLVLGGGVGLAVLAYVGGGLFGIVAGLASALGARQEVAVMMSRDHG
jgi:hypothetical protein